MLPEIERDADGRERLSIRSATFTLRKDGIILAQPTSVDVELDDAKEMVEALHTLRRDGHGKLLLDQQSVTRKLSSEARSYLADNTEQFEKIAIIVGSAVSRFLASGILMVTGKRKKVQIFDSEIDAVSWLLQEPVAATSK